MYINGYIHTHDSEKSKHVFHIGSTRINLNMEGGEGNKGGVERKSPYYRRRAQDFLICALYKSTSNKTTSCYTSKVV